MSKSQSGKVLKLFGVAMKDDRLTNSHRNLYLAMLICWEEQSYPALIKITRKDLMCRSKIASSSTYHLAINQLIRLRYVQYKPTYDPYRGSKVRVYI